MRCGAGREIRAIVLSSLEHFRSFFPRPEPVGPGASLADIAPGSGPCIRIGAKCADFGDLQLRARGQISPVAWFRLKLNLRLGFAALCHIARPGTAFRTCRTAPRCLGTSTGVSSARDLWRETDPALFGVKPALSEIHAQYVRAPRAEALARPETDGRRQPRAEVMHRFQRADQCCAARAAAGALQRVDEHARCGERCDLCEAVRIIDVVAVMQQLEVDDA